MLESVEYQFPLLPFTLNDRSILHPHQFYFRLIGSEIPNVVFVIAGAVGGRFRVFDLFVFAVETFS